MAEAVLEADDRKLITRVVDLLAVTLELGGERSPQKRETATSTRLDGLALSPSTNMVYRFRTK
jgi:hypothetical protein